MKKIISFAVLAGLSVSAYAAPMYPTYVSSNSYVDANYSGDSLYRYADREKTNWYATIRAELALLNWTNTYSMQETAPTDAGFGGDKYSLEPVFGGNLAVGHKFTDAWRAELEAGYIGYFSDTDPISHFTMQIPYLMVNGFYDFQNGFYLGAGFGVSLVITEIYTLMSTPENRYNTGASPMGAVMLGYALELGNDFVLDVRYRLSGMMGDQHRFYPTELFDGSATFWVQNEIGFILDNSLSVGLRYEF